MAVTIITGTRARTDIASHREDTDYSRGVAVLDPNENPFTLATMDIKRGNSKTIDKHWSEDELMPERTTITTTNATSATTAISVASGTGKYFAHGDLVRHLRTDEIFLIASVSTDALTVVRDYGQSVEGWTAKAGSITEDDVVEIIGNASEQSRKLPSVRSTVVVDYKNYCQTERTPIALSEDAEEAAYRDEDDWSLQERKGGISHMRKIEFTNFWGKPYIGGRDNWDADDATATPTSAGGINHFIETYGDAANKLDETDLTMDEFMTYLESLFTYGSDQRMCYCDSNLRTALDKWGISKLQTFSKEKIMGIDVSVWLSSHGTIVFKTHKMLKQTQSGLYKYAFFLDMEKVEWITYGAKGHTRYRPLNVYDATGETARKAEWQTKSCIKFGEAKTHGRLRWKTIS